MRSPGARCTSSARIFEAPRRGVLQVGDGREPRADRRPSRSRSSSCAGSGQGAGIYPRTWPAPSCRGSTDIRTTLNSWPTSCGASRTPPPRLAELEGAVARAIEHQSLAYLDIWESIKSPVHRRLLVALASEPRPKMGADFVRRHGLVSRSHVQRAERALVERGLVEDGRVIDPIFRMWLKGAPGRLTESGTWTLVKVAVARAATGGLPCKRPG